MVLAGLPRLSLQPRQFPHRVKAFLWVGVGHLGHIDTAVAVTASWLSWRRL
jgi:hypothetical protein